MNQQEKWNDVAAKAQSMHFDLSRVKSELQLQVRKIDSAMDELDAIALFCDHETKPDTE